MVMSLINPVVVVVVNRLSRDCVATGVDHSI